MEWICQYLSHKLKDATGAGVSFDNIRLGAGCSKDSKTFTSFYNRPIIDNTEFAKTVLTS